MKKAVILLAFLGMTACPADMWIPIQTMPRTPVAFDHVQFIDEVPSRPYDVVGIITPPADEYETEAEAVKAIRKEAAKHGADAIFIESKDPTSGWKFSTGWGGAKGGSTGGMAYRAKAIVWK